MSSKKFDNKNKKILNENKEKKVNENNWPKMLKGIKCRKGEMKKHISGARAPKTHMQTFDFDKALDRFKVPEKLT